ncbi:MAG: DEAD/DEAH box helicase [Candidatus Hydrogenedentes bacterium]|nr:DEAD/DEAH box helicase [Candidatus Hydrogenedentota bacterium]
MTKKTLGEDAAKRIGPTAARTMASAIEEAGGREVFFAGTIDAKGLIIKARVWARGTEGAVPAVFEGLNKGDVVLHNHPGGNIAPSDADIQLASVFGFNGHGVYIVDNDVRRVYVVVEPLLDKARTPLDAHELTGMLSPGSRLARLLPHFEVRPQQVAMMESVAQAFNEDGIAVIEAPTGVGKTVAYLLPAVVWAVRNRQRVVISTKTITLQEQIIHKDIPVIQKCLGATVNAVLVKGRGNYLCQRKLNRALSEASLYEDEGEQSQLRAIAEWAEKTEDGSLSDLPFVPAKNLWSNICSESDTCRIAQCPDPKKCFLGKARREVARADVLVVNHHMLFSDLAIKREMGSFTALAVLPSYKRVIFDEAHSIEDSATEYFGVDVTRIGALALIGRFVRSERNRERGLIPFLMAKLQKEKFGPSVRELLAMLDVADNQLLPALASAREALIVAFDAIRSLTAERCGQVGRDIKWRLTAEVLEDAALRDIHSVYVLPAVEEIRKCAQIADGLAKLVREIPKPDDGTESPFMTELLQLEAYRDRLIRLAGTFSEGTSSTLEPNTVRWIEIDAENKGIVRVVRCPLEVGRPMADWVYTNLKSIVMTSATLSVQRNFDYLFSRIGLDRVEDREPGRLELDSPFDFESQALLCIPTDIASPDERGFLEESVDHIREILKITKGHAFVLFTSFFSLDFAFRKLESELKTLGITPLKQGSAARTQLLDRFRADTSSVLFATDSFWEGVDVAGDALQCVILQKLPFRVPTEPVLEARAEAVDAAGGNSFMDFTVPQATIKFRQGFGRLIRRRTDRGAVIVLDKRIATKRYGRVFLESLPGIKVLKGTRQGVYLGLRKFFQGPSHEEDLKT